MFWSFYIVQWAHIGSYECTWSSCECIFGLHSDHMVPYQHIFDPQRPIWIHIKAVLGPYGFLSGAFLDRMYPYAIIWSHIGVLWIHVGYLLGPYRSTAQLVRSSWLLFPTSAQLVGFGFAGLSLVPCTSVIQNGRRIPSKELQKPGCGVQKWTPVGKNWTLRYRTGLLW